MGNEIYRTQYQIDNRGKDSCEMLSCGRTIGLRYRGGSRMRIGDVYIVGNVYVLLTNWFPNAVTSAVSITADLLSGQSGVFPHNRARSFVVQDWDLERFNKCTAKDWHTRHMELCNLFKDIPLP